MASETITPEQGQRRTAVVSIGAAIVLVVLKLGTGLATGSLGLISAGIESSGDVIAALLTFFAIRLGARPADQDHPFGHRRAENLAALGEATILIFGGIVVTVEAIGRLGDGGTSFDPAWYVFLVIAVALVIDVSRMLVSIRTSARYGSAALRSNAFHFAGDMAGSLAVLVGLVLVSAGFRQGDALAALLVAVIIFGAATRLILENAQVLMDRTPELARQRAERAIRTLDTNAELRRLRVRESGGRYFADVVVSVPAGQAIVEGHAAADAIEEAVRAELPGSDVVVHVEPRRRGLDLRDRALAAALSEPLVREAHDIAIFQTRGRATVSLHLKLAEDLAIADAHAAAERVSAAILAEPDVEDVLTHLEPLERPVAAQPVDAIRDAEEHERIAATVLRLLGTPPRELRLIRTEAGLVVFVVVGVGTERTLDDAHRLASELEEEIRRDRGYIAEVVVHTEP